jgi:arginase
MGKTIDLISVPYDSAHFNERMGAGPLHIINGGLIQHLESAGYVVNHKTIVQHEEFSTEIASTIKLLSHIKVNVAHSIQNKSFPIVLSGNCCATVGVIAAFNESDVGVTWFDAHGDCETPETTTSGFLDGMGLSMLNFSCWHNLLSDRRLNCSLPGKNIMLIGAGDLSKYEKDFISSRNINHISVDEIKSSNEIIKAGCSELITSGIRKLHLHIDVDVIDPSVAVVNSYAVDSGLGKDELFQTIDICATLIPKTSVTLASYDPLFDKEDKMRSLINELIMLILKYIQ